MVLRVGLETVWQMDAEGAVKWDFPEYSATCWHTSVAGENEEIITAACDMQNLSDIRGSIPVFRDRRPELY